MKNKSADELTRITKRIHAIGKSRPSHKEVLDFYKCIFREQHKIRPSIKVKSPAVSEETAKTCLREGFPLLDRREIHADLDSVTTLFKNICRSLMRNYAKSAPEIKKITLAVRKGEIDLKELFGMVVEGDREYIGAIAENRDFNSVLLRVLAESSLNPFFAAHADKLKGRVDQESWLRNYCPVCGSGPVLGELKDVKDVQGAKFLLCSACGFEWRYQRLRCPFCGNGDHEKLRYFNTEADGKGFMMDVCEECKKYIKTIDLRETGPAVVPLVDDLGTLHLDIIALKEGYTRGTPGILEMEHFGR